MYILASSFNDYSCLLEIELTPRLIEAPDAASQSERRDRQEGLLGSESCRITRGCVN
jgi:hypothetical protein